MKTKTTPFVLRKWENGDEHSLVKHANHKEVWQYMTDSFPHPYTIQKARRWIQLANDSQKEFHMAIEVRGEPVGCIGLVLKDDVYRRSAELGYWLSPYYWNQGIMTNAIKQMVIYAFETFNINRIYARVFEGNLASIRVLRKAGFQHEGTLRKAVYKNGKYLNEYIYGLLD
ncbi:MAG: GNAT family N-acetyltransferase [Marinifilaceae bacterium]